MADLYRPFPSSERSRLAALLTTPPASIDAFEERRAALSDAPAPLLNGLRALAAAEPGLEARLARRVFPSIFQYSRALLEKDDPSLPLHRADEPARTRVERAEVASWVAHILLGTLPRPGRGHPDVDASLLLARRHAAHELAKLRCILEYFDRIHEAPPPGVLEIERVVASPRDTGAWAADASPLTPLTVDEEGAIEDSAAHRHVDFANRYLGGGVLSGGCVQEEIRFAVAPELLAAMIISPRMGDAEAIVLRGAERFAAMRGYGFSLEYDGPFNDPTPSAPDLGGAPDVELSAIDALDFRKRDPRAQLSEAGMLRELNKARAGFMRDARGLPVATGNWGCGVFLGDPPLKAALQWLAASAEGRAVRYYTFGDERVGDLAGFAAAARAKFKTVGALWGHLCEAVGEGGPELYSRIIGE